MKRVISANLARNILLTSLNTIGNLVSGVAAGNWFFAPLTFVLAFFGMRLALEKP